MTSAPRGGSLEMASTGNQNTGHSLFRGARFWLSQTVPQRLRFKEEIAKHGGIVVLMEKDADVKLVDHAKKGLPPDTYSYRYIERSIQNGRLEDLEAHRIAAPKPRPTGATHIAAKGTRLAFTLKDDQILFDWIAHVEKEDGGTALSGGKVYMALEEIYPHHSWQSWRTRYLRQLRGKPRPGGGVPESHPEFEPNFQYGLKRKRDIEPTPVDEPQAGEIPPSKKREVERYYDSTQLGRSMPSSSQPEPSNMPAKPTSNTPSKHNVAASPTAKAHGIRGDPTPFQVPSPFAGTHRGNLAFPPPPFSTSQPPAPMPRPRPEQTAPMSRSREQKLAPIPRPRGDNAFAQSGRVKKQPNKDRPRVDDPFKDPVDAVFLELPFFPSSPESDAVDDDTSDGPDVDTWIDERLNRGIDEVHVFDALRCTSMVPDMADKVLEHLAAGHEIPDGVPGVWTADDDQCLQAEERAKVERALTKHGADHVKERWEYYRMARETGLI